MLGGQNPSKLIRHPFPTSKYLRGSILNVRHHALSKQAFEHARPDPVWGRGGLVGSGDETKSQLTHLSRKKSFSQQVLNAPMFREVMPQVIVPQEQPLMMHVKKQRPTNRVPAEFLGWGSSLSATFVDSPFLNGRNDNGCTSISIGTLRYLPKSIS